MRLAAANDQAALEDVKLLHVAAYNNPPMEEAPIAIFCVAAGFVDMTTGMLLGVKTVDSHPAEVLELVAAATADMFQGANVTMIEKMFKKARGLKQSGSLTAPFDCIQGWQFSNFADGAVVIRVKLTGFYELVPAGSEGNLAGIVANVPAAQARPDYKPTQP